MKYRVLILPSAQRVLEQLPGRDYENVLETILALGHNPRPPGCKKLEAREGWRVRQGDYRVIYEIDDPEKSVTVLRVRRRREVYR
jgi:mRNA interferase RelE/StbE